MNAKFTQADHGPARGSEVHLGWLMDRTHVGSSGLETPKKERKNAL